MYSVSDVNFYIYSFILIWSDFKPLFLGSLSLLDDHDLWVNRRVIEDVLNAYDPEKMADDIYSFRDFLSRACDYTLSHQERMAYVIDFVRERDITSQSNITLPVMCCAAFDYFGGFDGKADYVFPVLASAVLGEVENGLTYHNNSHFRKVLFHVIRLIAAHNHIFENSNLVLDEQKIALLLACACAHDLGHSAQGNFENRKYVFAAQERRSFGYVKPFLLDLGFTSSMCDDVYMMIVTTDVTPFGDPLSPANQLRSAYEYHFGTSEYDDNIQLRSELRDLQENSKLCLLSMLLHEADLMNSSGVDYDITIEESRKISQEIGKSITRPEDTYLFLKVICHERMITDAAQLIAGENIRRIISRICEDIQRGIQSY